MKLFLVLVFFIFALAVVCPANSAAIIAAHLAGETVRAVMFFGGIWILLGYIEFSRKSGNFFKGHGDIPFTRR